MKLSSVFLFFFLIITISISLSLAQDDSEYDGDNEDGDSDTSSLNLTSTTSTTAPSTTKSSPSVTTTLTRKLNSTSTTTSTSISYSEAETEEDSDEEEEEVSHDKNKRIRVTRKPFEVEGESLSKLQKFMLSNVETVLKDAMPLILRSGLETNVSAACASSLLTMVSALRESKIWAFTMLDASGKLPSGILDGTLTDLGSFDECLDVRSDVEATSRFVGQYCILDMRPAFEQNIPLGSKPPPGITPNDLVWDHTLQRFWSNNDLLSFRYGACIPSSCTRDDFDQLVNYCESGLV